MELLVSILPVSFTDRHFCPTFFIRPGGSHKTLYWYWYDIPLHQFLGHVRVRASCWSPVSLLTGCKSPNPCGFPLRESEWNKVTHTSLCGVSLLHRQKYRISKGDRAFQQNYIFAFNAVKQTVSACPPSPKCSVSLFHSFFSIPFHSFFFFRRETHGRRSRRNDQRSRCWWWWPNQLRGPFGIANTLKLYFIQLEWCSFDAFIFSRNSLRWWCQSNLAYCPPSMYIQLFASFLSPLPPCFAYSSRLIVLQKLWLNVKCSSFTASIRIRRIRYHRAFLMLGRCSVLV